MRRDVLHVEARRKVAEDTLRHRRTALAEAVDAEVGALGREQQRLTGRVRNKAFSDRYRYRYCYRYGYRYCDRYRYCYRYCDRYRYCSGYLYRYCYL